MSTSPWGGPSAPNRPAVPYLSTPAEGSRGSFRFHGRVDGRPRSTTSSHDVVTRRVRTGLPKRSVDNGRKTGSGEMRNQNETCMMSVKPDEQRQARTCIGVCSPQRNAGFSLGQVLRGPAFVLLFEALRVELGAIHRA